MTAHPLHARAPRLDRLAAVVAIFTIPAPAFAQSCSVTGASGSYGLSDVLPGTPITGSSTFTVSCSGRRNRTVILCIGFSYGVNYGGVTTQRIMSGASNGLTHDLFIDAARTQVWGAPNILGVAAYPGAILTYPLNLGGSGVATTPAIPVYGQIYGSQQTAAPGAYTWSTGTPGVQYDYNSGAACPTGAFSAVAGTGSSLWTATVPAMCRLNTAPLDFGSQGLLSASVNAQTALSVQCTRTTPYSVAFSAGNGPGATTANRMMTGPAGGTIGYALYRDAARTQNWGNGAADSASGTGTGLAQNFNVYGRVAAQNTPAPGVYSDTIVVTVTY